MAIQYPSIVVLPLQRLRRYLTWCLQLCRCRRRLERPLLRTGHAVVQARSGP